MRMARRSLFSASLLQRVVCAVPTILAPSRDVSTFYHPLRRGRCAINVVPTSAAFAKFEPCGRVELMLSPYLLDDCVKGANRRIKPSKAQKRKANRRKPIVSLRRAQVAPYLGTERPNPVPTSARDRFLSSWTLLCLKNNLLQSK